MATSIRDLSDAKLVEVYNSYLKSDTSNWTIGVGLLREISRRFGDRFEKASYLEGIGRVVAIKPVLRGRVEEFFPSDFAIPLSELKTVVNELTRDVCLAAPESVIARPVAGTIRYESPIITDRTQYGKQVELLLGNSKGLFKSTEPQRLLTFGSCFAVNLGRLLKDKGRSVYTLVIAEDVNSPFNNLQLLRRVFLEEETPISEELSVISGVDYESLRQEFLNASDIIFTLGNIFHLELDGCSTLLASDGATLVAETLDQTVSCLNEIFDLLCRFTKANILVSVSPVPISGYRGTDFASAME